MRTNCLIAMLAEENDAALLVKDRDMVSIAGSGLCDVRLIRP